MYRPPYVSDCIRARHDVLPTVHRVRVRGIDRRLPLRRGRMLSPALTSHLQPPNSSLKYCVLAVHVFATLGRLVTCVVSTYAFGVP